MRRYRVGLHPLVVYECAITDLDYTLSSCDLLTKGYINIDYLTEACMHKILTETFISCIQYQNCWIMTTDAVVDWMRIRWDGNWFDEVKRIILLSDNNNHCVVTCWLIACVRKLFKLSLAFVFIFVFFRPQTEFRSCWNFRLRPKMKNPFSVSRKQKALWKVQQWPERSQRYNRYADQFRGQIRGQRSMSLGQYCPYKFVPSTLSRYGDFYISSCYYISISQCPSIHSCPNLSMNMSSFLFSSPAW